LQSSSFSFQNRCWCNGGAMKNYLTSTIQQTREKRGWYMASIYKQEPKIESPLTPFEDRIIW